MPTITSEWPNDKRRASQKPLAGTTRNLPEQAEFILVELRDRKDPRSESKTRTIGKETTYPRF